MTMHYLAVGILVVLGLFVTALIVLLLRLMADDWIEVVVLVGILCLGVGAIWAAHYLENEKKQPVKVESP